MKKTFFKKILCIINYTRHHVSPTNLLSYVQQQLHEDTIDINEVDLKVALNYIEEKGMLYYDQTGFDLIPCACVFAKADYQSISEVLAYIECLMKDKQLIVSLEDVCANKKAINKSIFDSFTWDILTQTILLDRNHDEFHINPVLISDIESIIQEYKKNDVIISSTLSAIYANEIIHHENTSIKYRNEDKQMVPYINSEQILQIIPRLGIPENRDITKPVQTFYKDTLMHEFHHACPLCGIDISQLLVASHIKPFRDCAHIFEALDHHNGLLLCKNHDFLFDQGYISFDDDGKIMICDELKNKKVLYHALQISEDTTINDKMSASRKLFMDYHRKSIYKK